MILRLCRTAVRLAAALIPANHRERWRREWDAELVAWSRTRSVPGRSRPIVDWRLLRRTFVAVADAATMRWQISRLERERTDRGDRSDRTERPAGRSWLGPPLDELIQDLRYGARRLGRSPGFASVALLTIALGIAVTTTMFSLIRGILLAPLPYPEPERLVVVWPEQWYSQRFFEQLESDAISYESIAGFAYRGGILTAPRESGEGGAELLLGPRVTDGFFDVLGVEPFLGRTFRDGEDQPGRDDVLLVSYRLWQRRFGGTADALGRRVPLTGVDRTLIGVLPPGLLLPQQASDVVFPQRMEPGVATYTSAELKAIARLAPGVTLEEATAELQALVPRWREEQGRPEGWGSSARVMPLREFLVGETRPGLLLLFAAVGLLLLIATVNVANLLLAHSLTRRREMAMRLALGAGWFRLARQLLAESTLIGLVGGLVGFAAAVLSLPFVTSLLPDDTPRLAGVVIDGWVVGFCVLLSLLNGWIVGLLPALAARSADLSRRLRAHGRGSSSGGGRLRSILVVAEVSLAVLLLAGCGLLAKSFWRLQQVDPGFEEERLFTFELIPDSRSVRTADEAERYFEQIEHGLEALPEVESAATVWKAPLALDGGITFYWAHARPPAPGESAPVCRFRPISPDYFQTAGIPLLAGRSFTAADHAAAEPVAVLSKAAAERLFPEGDVLGRKIYADMPGEVAATVVGVVGDVRMLGPARGAPNAVYRPYLQSGPVIDAFEAYPRAFVVRIGTPGAAVLGQIRSAVLTVDANAVLHEPRTFREAIDDALSDRRVVTLLLALFSSAALVLGAIGVYGVMAFSVRARMRETGIRIALGASPRDVVLAVLGRSLRIAGIGALTGVALALALSRVLERFVFEIEPTDPAVLLAAVGVALVTAVVASVLPARRAARTDPATTITVD